MARQWVLAFCLYVSDPVINSPVDLFIQFLVCSFLWTAKTNGALGLSPSGGDRLATQRTNAATAHTHPLQHEHRCHYSTHQRRNKLSTPMQRRTSTCRNSTHQCQDSTSPYTATACTNTMTAQHQHSGCAHIGSYYYIYFLFKQ